MNTNNDTNTKSIIVNSSNIGRKVEILGNRIHYVQHEGNETVILLHGVGFSLFAMRNMYGELIERGYHVIALDLPGCGYSSLNTKQKFTPEHMADVLKGFMDAQKIESAHFFGVAEGGTYAMCLCELYPEKVKSLTLCSPGSLTNTYPYIYRQITLPVFGEIYMRFLKRKNVEAALNWIYFNKTKITPTIQRQTYTPFESKENRLWFLYLLRDYNDSAVYNHLHLIKCKTLFVWGEYDNAHPVDMSHRLLDEIKASKLLKLQTTGHMVYELRAKNIIDGMEEIIKVSPPIVDDEENIE